MSSHSRCTPDKQRGPRWRQLDVALAPFDAASVEAMTRAAVDSPGASHWAAAVQMVWARALAHPTRGTAAAAPGDLPGLVDAALRAWPMARDLSDWWPSDPRLVVTASLGGGQVRLHPGRMIDPVRLVRRLVRIAFACDDAVAARRGFRVTDLVEAGLRLADLQVRMFAPAWPTGALREPLLLRADDGSPFEVAAEVQAIPPTVNADEVAAARSLQERDLLAEAVEACADPAAAADALAWATAPAVRAHHPGCLAVRVGKTIVPVPASLVLESLATATAELAAAVADDRGVRERWTVSAAADLWEALGLPFPDDGEGGVRAGGVLRIAERHLVSIDVAAELCAGRTADAVTDAARRSAARSIAEAAEVAGLPASAPVDLLRLVVVDAPGRPERLGGGPVLVVAADEFVRVLADAADGPHGQDEAWDFLLDLQRLPDEVELRPAELVDAWRHWREHGWLLPPGFDQVTDAPDGAAILLGWLAHDPSWADAAAWDPTERLLEAARLPGVAAYRTRHLDERGAATLWAPPAMTDGRPTCYAVHEAGLVIAATGELPGARIRDDAGDLPFAIATAVRDALLDRPAAAAALGLDPAAPATILIAVDPEDEDGDGVAVATADELPPLILVGPRLLAAVAADPAATHAMLGAAVAKAVQLDGRSVAPDAFDAAWQAGPVAMVAAVRAAPADRSARRALPRSRAARFRAHEAHAVAVRAAGHELPAGQADGATAADLCRHVLVPSADQALRDAIAKFDRDLLVRAAAAWADEAHAQRAEVRHRLDLAMAAPWRDAVLADPTDYDVDPDQTRPLHVLVETALACDRAPDATGKCPDRLDLAGLAEQARLLVWIGTAADGYHRGINPLAAVTWPSGLAVVTIPDADASAPSAPLVDMEAYVAALNAETLATRAEKARLQDPADVEQLLADNDGGERPFQHLTDLPSLPGSLRELDREMGAAFGAGFDAIAAVLATAVDIAPPPLGMLPDPVPFDALRDNVAAWAARLPPAQIAAAIHLLTVDTDRVRADPSNAWDVEQRDARLTARPLIGVHGGLIVLPHLCAAAREILLGRLDDGRLPWPVHDKPLQLALDTYRQHVTRKLERDLDERLTGLGVPHAMNVKENRAAAAGIPDLPGEIDALAADAATGTLWVIEAKHIRRGVSAREIRARVRSFTDPGGHIDTLLRKTAAIAAHPHEAAALAGGERSRVWRVAPLLVTASTEPAGFASPRRVQFTTVERLDRAVG